MTGRNTEVMQLSQNGKTGANRVVGAIWRKMRHDAVPDVFGDLSAMRYHLARTDFQEEVDQFRDFLDRE